MRLSGVRLHADKSFVWLLKKQQGRTAYADAVKQSAKAGHMGHYAFVDLKEQHEPFRGSHRFSP